MRAPITDCGNFPFSPAIQNSTEPVAMQAIEFWNTLCETETEIMYDQQEGKSVDQNFKQYIRSNIAQLLPVIYSAMCRQSDDEDPDGNGISDIASVCMELCSSAIGDQILQIPNMKQVIENITNAEWRARSDPAKAI